MIVACKAVPRAEMARFKSFGDSPLSVLSRGFDRTWIISITEPGTRPLFGEMSNVLPLQFDDVDADDLAAKGLSVGSGTVLFSLGQSVAVCAFIRRAHEDPATGLLAVNCYAGVSRSGAIVTFAADVCGVDRRLLGRMNPQIAPNKFVYRLLAEAWNSGT